VKGAFRGKKPVPGVPSLISLGFSHVPAHFSEPPKIGLVQVDFPYISTLSLVVRVFLPPKGFF
jgi:hypothetical protein